MTFEDHFANEVMRTFSLLSFDKRLGTRRITRRVIATIVSLSFSFISASFRILIHACIAKALSKSLRTLSD
jgi:hypothetical protein